MSRLDPCFPWQQEIWQQLVNRRNADQLPHALLIKGAEGIGKNIFAKNKING